MSFKDFSNIITSYQSPTTGTHSPTTKNIMPPRKCLQCGTPLSSSTLGPYCSSQCMNKHDAGIPGATTEVNHSNIMRQFSEVLSQ